MRQKRISKTHKKASNFLKFGTKGRNTKDKKVGRKDKKFILICGGVISGVGKGIATASLGLILKKYGFKVNVIKIDPYINVDAGTLRPTEHGEVWVTFDGGETDQDLGSYERFLNQEFPRTNNITTGKVYKSVIERERQGYYLGKTVQFIPHIVDEIKQRIYNADNSDITLIELGGTVGDYENLPFLFAMKSLEKDIGEQNVLYVLVSYLPIPHNIGEMKTKPTQQAIRQLAETGIYPDVVIARAERPLDEVRKGKIEKYANIPKEFVISAPDISNVYEAPLNFETDNLGLKVLNKLNLKPRKIPNWRIWKQLVNHINKADKRINISIVGKYLTIGDYELDDSYISVVESLKHAAAKLRVKVNINFVSSQDIEKKGTSVLKSSDGIIVPGGFGSHGVEGKIRAIKYARENKIPYLGLCFGLQLAVVEFARNVIGFKDAHTTEINPKTKHPVIMILPEQVELLKKHSYGASMRLGEYTAVLDEKSRVFQLYKETGRLKEDTLKIKNYYSKHKEQSFRLGFIPKNRPVVLERHRHRYEVNPKYIPLVENEGLKISGFYFITKDNKLAEFIELKDHPFFIATQAHPEFKSRLTNPSPLFYGFVRATKDTAETKQL